MQNDEIQRGKIVQLMYAASAPIRPHESSTKDTSETDDERYLRDMRKINRQYKTVAKRWHNYTRCSNEAKCISPMASSGAYVIEHNMPDKEDTNGRLLNKNIINNRCVRANQAKMCRTHRLTCGRGVTARSARERTHSTDQPPEPVCQKQNKDIP